MKRITLVLLLTLAFSLVSCASFLSRDRVRIEIAAEPQLVKATLLAVISTSKLPDLRDCSAVLTEAQDIYAQWLQTHPTDVDQSKHYVFVGPAMRQKQCIEVDYPEMRVHIECAK